MFLVFSCVSNLLLWFQTPIADPCRRDAADLFSPSSGLWVKLMKAPLCLHEVNSGRDDIAHRVRRLLLKDCLQKFLLIYNSCIQKQKAQHGWKTTTARYRITCSRAADWSTAPHGLRAASCICFQRDRKNINVSLRVVKCQPRTAFKLCHPEVGPEWKLDEMSDRMKENKRANTKSPVSALKADIWPGVRALHRADSKCRKIGNIWKMPPKQTKDFPVKIEKIPSDRDGMKPPSFGNVTVYSSKI